MIIKGKSSQVGHDTYLHLEDKGEVVEFGFSDKKPNFTFFFQVDRKHFENGLLLVFPERMKEGMNPVTFTGSDDYRISLGRLNIPAAAPKRNNPIFRQSWLKTKTTNTSIVTLIVWKGEQESVGTMVLPESEFIEAMHKIKVQLNESSIC